MSKRLKADLTLLAVAAIWGSAFVAQRLGNEQVGPFTFNGVRFPIGSLVLLPAIVWRRRTGTESKMECAELRAGIILGLLLFGGASLQQLGLVQTTAGKGGFITGLYVVIVPLLLALIWRQRVRWNNWLGAVLAVGGLFLLSLSGQEVLRLAPGDSWVLAGAFLWALHVIAVGRFASGYNPLRLALIQYAVCGLLSGGTALVVEWGTWDRLSAAMPAILYAGVLSTGLAYTGQIVAQRHTLPADAAIIMSMEAVFATLAGWLILGERLTGQQLTGCGLVLVGMLLAQISALVPERNRAL
jgi:drug/metabolite transporter (DMT)-like permease